MMNPKAENAEARIILDRLNDRYCSLMDPTVVDWEQDAKDEIESLWQLRDKADISPNQLTDIAWFLKELFRDGERAMTLIRAAAEKNALRSLALYEKTVSHLSRVEETRNGLISLFVEEGCRFVCLDYEEEAREQVAAVLYDFYNLAMTYDGTDFQNRLKNLMNYYYDEGWHRCDVLGKIVEWLGLYAPDERYVVSLERLLRTRLEALGYEETGDLTAHAWDSDEGWFYDLGIWYIESEDGEARKKGLRYLINGRGGEADLIGLEPFVRWTRALYRGGVKTDHKSPAFWSELAADMENANRKRGETAFSEFEIVDCRARANAASAWENERGESTQ